MTVALLLLFAALVLVGGVLFIWLRIEPLLFRWVTLQEQRSGPVKRKEGAAIPLDLVVMAMQESSPWAREDKLRYLQQLYEEQGSWDNVQAVMAARDQGASQ